MAIDSSLSKEITEFLIKLPLLQNKEGRQAILLSAGLQEALPHIDLSGSPYEFVARLVDLLETYTTLSDGQFALICFLQEIGNQLGQDRREILHKWCQQLQSQLKARPIASLSYQRPISYLAPFQAPPLPQHFVPRPEVTDTLKERLLNNEATTPGILVVSAIHGLGGIGKSTLAAALAYDKEMQERFPDGILWATLGQQPEVLSLISSWVHEMRDYDFRPTTIEAASAHLRTLLQDKAVLLVVDDVWNPEHAVHFKVGGPCCQVLITTRRADVADEVGAELHQMDVMTPEQSLELLAARLQRALEAAERDEALSLAEAVGYLPLALELAAVRVARGMSWAALYEALQQETANLNALEGSPRRRRKGATTLEACFNFSLNALRSEDEEAWNAFVWLGVLPEDVQIAAPMAATLWEMEQTEAHDLLELLWNDALLLPGTPILVGNKEYSTYRLHDLLHDIACKLLTKNQPQRVKLAHTVLLRRYKQHTQNNLWHTLPDDGYIHEHLIWHFLKAGREKLIHNLLQEETEEGRNGWYQARERLGQTAGFIENVTLAGRLAEQDRKFGLQCRYTLMMASFNSLAQNISGNLLTTLVEHGIWSHAQGLAYARQIPNLKEHRIETFIKLSACLPQTLRDIALQDALTAAQAIQYKWRRAMTLARLATNLPAAWRTSVLQDALAAAQAIQYETLRMQVLTELAQHLPETLRLAALQDALMVVRTIPNEEKRGEALSKIAPHLPETLLRSALTMAQAIQKDRERAETLTGLIPYLPDKLRTSALQDAIRAAQGIKSENTRAKALTGLLPYLPDQSRTSIIEDALTAAQAIQYNWVGGARVLNDLGPYLSDALLQAALTTAQTIEDEGERAQALIGLAPYLPDALLQDALMAAQGIKSENTRAKALTGLLPYLPDTLRTSVLQAALKVAQTIKHVRSRARALAELGPYLSNALLQDALTAAQAIEDGGNRAQTLTRLLPYLPDALRLTALQNALLIVQEIEYEGIQVEVLTGVAPHLPDALFQDALRAAQAIKVEKMRAKALTGLLPYLPDTLRIFALQDALKTVQAIEYEWELVEALTGLIPYLSDTLRASILQDALKTAQAIKVETAQVKALTELAPHLPDVLLRDALVTVQTIKYDWMRVEALTGLLPYLPDALRASVLQDALRTAQALEGEAGRAKALTELAPHLPDVLLRDALMTVQMFKDAGYRAEAWIWMFPHLPSMLRTISLQDLLRAVQTIDEEKRAQALSGLIPYLPDKLRTSVLQDALTAAQTIESNELRTKALTSLVQRLIELPVAELVSLWHDLLEHSVKRDRSDLLSDFRALTPMIVKLGGKGAIIELYHAIQDVGRWWP